MPEPARHADIRGERERFGRPIRRGGGPSTMTPIRGLSAVIDEAGEDEHAEDRHRLLRPNPVDDTPQTSIATMLGRL